MKARTVSTPLLCCSVPRPVRTIAEPGGAEPPDGLPQRRLAARRSAARRAPGGTAAPPGAPRRSPVVRSRCTPRRSSSSSMRDVQQAVGECEVGAGRELAGTGRRCGRWRSGAGRRRSGGRRLAFCFSNHCMIGGSVSAAFDPTSRITSARRCRSTGKGRPRSMPNARLPPAARARHAVAAVVVDVRGAERRRGRTCRAGTPSRWSAPRSRRRPTASGAVLAPSCGDRVRDDSPAPRPNSLARSSPAESRTQRRRQRGPGGRAASSAVQPLMQSWPLFTGKCGSPCTPAGDAELPRRSASPHWNAQYGQCVRDRTAAARAGERYRRRSPLTR